MSSSRTVAKTNRSMGKLFLLLVGILSTPGLGLGLVQRSHCAAHEASMMHVVHPGGGHVGHQGSILSWTRPMHSDCPHCPATECATVAPCSFSSTSATSPLILTLKTPPIHHLATFPVRVSVRSTTHQPPTPPPQTIA